MRGGAGGPGELAAPAANAAARTKFSLNISTHPGDLEVLEHDWDNARGVLGEEGFDGFELYPVGDYEWEAIPSELILGLHLRSYPLLAPFWRGDSQKLRAVFGDERVAAEFYGAASPAELVASWRRQFELAQRLGCEYVVFHLGDSDFEHLYDWRFPWEWRQSIDLCAEILNAVTAEVEFDGELLLENLWWPGSFRALTAEEIEYALAQVAFPRTGVVLDTGHLLGTDQDLQTEAQGIEYLISVVRSLGAAGRAIHGVHLTRSLSADYVRRTCAAPPPLPAGPFWEQFSAALEHVSRIDQHDPFEEAAICGLFAVLEPKWVTYEFSYASRREWVDKIRRQRRAMAAVHARRRV